MSLQVREIRLVRSLPDAIDPQIDVRKTIKQQSCPRLAKCGRWTANDEADVGVKSEARDRRQRAIPAPGLWPERHPHATGLIASQWTQVLIADFECLWLRADETGR